MEGTCLEGDVKEKFGVYPSWSSQGKFHVTQVTSGGGFQSLFRAGILSVRPSACLGRNWRNLACVHSCPPPNSSYGSGILGSYFLYAKFFLIVSAIGFGAWFGSSTWERRDLPPSFSARRPILLFQYASPTPTVRWELSGYRQDFLFLTRYFTIVSIYLISFANIDDWLQFLRAKPHWSFFSSSIP